MSQYPLIDIILKINYKNKGYFCLIPNNNFLSANYDLSKDNVQEQLIVCCDVDESQFFSREKANLAIEAIREVCDKIKDVNSTPKEIITKFIFKTCTELVDLEYQTNTLMQQLKPQNQLFFR